MLKVTRAFDLNLDQRALGYLGEDGFVSVVCRRKRAASLECQNDCHRCPAWKCGAG